MSAIVRRTDSRDHRTTVGWPELGLTCNNLLECVAVLDDLFPLRPSLPEQPGDVRRDLHRGGEAVLRP